MAHGRCIPGWLLFVVISAPLAGGGAEQERRGAGYLVRDGVAICVMAIRVLQPPFLPIADTVLWDILRSVRYRDK